MNRKHLSIALSIALLSAAGALLVSCGGGDSGGQPSGAAKGFEQSVEAHFQTPHQQHQFVVYDNMDKNGATPVPAHEVLGQMVSPLQAKFANSLALDQGSTNSCATMSALAAVAIVTNNKADYYSPVCSLNLGNFLHYNNGYMDYPLVKTAAQDSHLAYFPSGWNGSTLGLVLSQIDSFGLAKKNSSCGSDSFFGTAAHTNAIEPKNFALMSSNISMQVSHTTLCSNDSTATPGCQCVGSRACVKPESIVPNIKSIIDSGGLALVSAALNSNLPNYGVSARYHYFDTNPNDPEPDVWAYSDAVKNCRENQEANCTLVSHEMIVFGYIDLPTNGGAGLLVLRNSWGRDAGDSGNYYMTYDYAQKQLLEVVKLQRK